VTNPLDERLTEATVGALEMFSVYLGTRLGLYQALIDQGELTGPALAAAAGIHPRYAREWLEQQAVAGLLHVDDPALAPDERRYRLPAEHVGPLADPTDVAHVAPFAELLVGVAETLDQVVAAYRSGAGVPYRDYGANLRHGQGAINRPAFSTDLTASWLPAIADVHAALSAPGAAVADLGCGVGWSTIALRRAYPRADVVGVDSDAASIEEATAHAREAGLDVRFVQADAAGLAELGRFDAVLLLECLHDMARPVETLAAARGAVADGGSVVVVDENVAPRFTAPGDLIERMMYGWSIEHCLPASMAEPPSAALGTVLRPDRLSELARAAGFSGAEIVDVDAGFFRVYRLR
jgi:2-polyprenyl-3-methyl-5-hydroxy-6-metoxy-1,4-benzoquinol methylase